MDVTISIDEEVLKAVSRRAEAMGTSLDQLVRDYLERFVGRSGAAEGAAEFERLSSAAKGHSGGWGFNSEEVHERR